ncbi:MAG: acetyl-CoA carboxylase biotin carboxylase subunit [Methylobacterium organophilum]|nr:acetyl-CoA carboxylase biotin carboxylase subunit [Methylobacterium organophilum]
MPYQNPIRKILQSGIFRRHSVATIRCGIKLLGGCVRRVLIANRGEIALRAIRACRGLGLETVAVHSSADRNASHVWAADRAVCIGPPPAKASYLLGDALIAVAENTGCDSIYPGYGFLSEKSAFAEACARSGLVFVGPDAESIALMGDKVAARRTAAALGIPVVPGSEGGYLCAADAEAKAREIGYPLLLKASGGGGGRGMRVAESHDVFLARFEQATAEAEAAFGQPEIYLERFFSAVRHIEIQVFGDGHGNAVHLWERDCSVQRRHQKLVEEAPSPVLPPDTRRAMAEAALALVRGLRYRNAGTVEFIYDVESGSFFFIEMNTRIQVEHPVTEMLTGTDLVTEQFRVARGEALSFGVPPEPDGRCVIEFRINAEDPGQDFRPMPGTLARWSPPVGPEIRLDSHVYEGYRVPPHYDSMLAKLIVAGASRADVLATARGALRRFQVAGVPTTIPFHAALIDDPDFLDGRVHTRWVENTFLPREAA